MNPVTICMPCYNSQAYVAEALASLQAQTYGHWQLVVVDDGSTDQSAAVVEATCPQARLIRSPHRGIGAALNLALAEVSPRRGDGRGELLAWVDADDLWLPRKLELQVESLARHADWDGCFVEVEQFRQDGYDVPSPLPGGRHRGALLIRCQAFERVGAFREDLEVGEFVDWCARAQQVGLRLGQVPEVLYRRRIHGQNTVLRDAGQARDYLKVLKLNLDRKRKS